ncbi:MAG: DUF222 domain-containing protein [Actinomycetes bacterium]
MLTVLALLASIADDLSSDKRVDLAVQLDRGESWVAAQKQLVFAACVRGTDSAETPRARAAALDDTAVELGLALAWSEGMVHDRLDVAVELDSRLPHTWQALADGRLNYAKAREIAHGAAKLPDDTKAAELERGVVAKADGQIQTEIRKAVERQVMRLDPAGAEARRRDARGRRQVRRSPGADSSAHLHVFGPAEAIAVIHHAMTDGARALKATGQVDTVDQGRFDTLLDWAIGHLDDRVLPSRGPLPVAATIIVKASTAAGADDDPAEVAGYGPITAHAARDLLAGRAPAPGPFDRDGGRFRAPHVPRDEDALPTYLRDKEPEPPSDRDELAPDDWTWRPPPEPDRQPPAAEPCSLAWRVLTVDPATGWAIPPPRVRMTYGTERRLASPAQARYVRDRDRTCAIPTCGQTHNLDIDHRTPAAAGGRTDIDNLGPACPHHNRTTRAHSAWTIEPNNDGSATLTTPHGRRYPIKPHDYLD